MADNALYAAVSPTRASAPIALGATSMTVAAIKDRLDNTLTMADFGSKGYGVISPGKEKEEQFVFTGISGNTVTGISWVTMKAPYTETSGFAESHAAGERVVLYTNSPAFYNSFLNKNNDEPIAGTFTFTSTAMPVYNTHPTFSADTQLIDKKYADDLAIAGAPDASVTVKGITEEATQAEIAAGTAAGATAARLFTNPSTLAAHIQSNAWLAGVTAGTADAITATLTPTLTALTHNMMFVLHTTNANNAGATLNIDGLGAKAIYKYAGGSAVAVEENDMKALYHHVFLYDSDATVFLLVNPVNGTLTAAMQTEIQNVFAATDVTGAELETLTSASTNNADSLHGHAGSFAGMNDTFLLDISTETVNYPVVGYSDATVKLITNGFNTTSPATYTKCLALAPDYGHAYYTKVLPTRTAVGNRGALYIGADLWTTDNSGTAGNRVQKNGSAVTISGTTPSNNARGLAHDPTNSYLLLLDTTTTVQRYSGISGTTITHVSTVTLDTAVSVLGFLYDNTNSRYICLDLSGNLIRRFDASGTTIDTAAFTVDDTVAGIGGVLTIAGLVFIRDRVHIAYVSVTDAGTPALARIEYIPTTMTR